jgi:hypothetical protein
VSTALRPDEIRFLPSLGEYVIVVGEDPDGIVTVTGRGGVEFEVDHADLEPLHIGPLADLDAIATTPQES